MIVVGWSFAIESRHCDSCVGIQAAVTQSTAHVEHKVRLGSAKRFHEAGSMRRSKPELSKPFVGKHIRESTGY